MLETTEYVTKPRTVVAVLITAENMAEAADWCGGEIEGEGESAFISVRAYRPINRRQTEAHIDDYLVKQGDRFKVYLKKSFLAGFDRKHKVEITNSGSPLDLPFAPGAEKEKSPIFDGLAAKGVTIPSRAS